VRKKERMGVLTPNLKKRSGEGEKEGGREGRREGAREHVRNVSFVFKSKVEELYHEET
jgi:hypothetical protein